jgi:hypothetical protein
MKHNAVSSITTEMHLSFVSHGGLYFEDFPISGQKQVSLPQRREYSETVAVEQKIYSTIRNRNN